MTGPFWSEVFERDRGYCQYCGADLLANFSVFNSATVDHVIQVAVNGKDEMGNLKLCCPSCNGMLSRSMHRTTFEERKTYVQACLAEKRKDYDEWARDLRKKA